jgi:hypothetical protein
MSSCSIKQIVLQDWLLPEQSSTMKVTPGKLLTNEEMESRVPSTLAHIVATPNQNGNPTSNRSRMGFPYSSVLLVLMP